MYNATTLAKKFKKNQKTQKPKYKTTPPKKNQKQQQKEKQKTHKWYFNIV